MATLTLRDHELPAYVSPEHIVYLQADALRSWLLACALANKREPELQDMLELLADVIAGAAKKAREARQL